MDISTTSHWLPYMDISRRSMATKLPYVEMFPDMEVPFNSRSTDNSANA